MTTAMRLTAYVVLGVAAAGCGGDAGANGSASDGDRARYEAVARQFGEHVLSGNWAAAYALTTAQFRGSVSQARLRAQYDELLRQIREDDPAFRPNRVEPAFGMLPEDETEAKEIYDMVLVPPKASWKAWMSAGIGFGDEQGIERGIDAWMLIIDDLGELKIGHVNFEFMD